MAATTISRANIGTNDDGSGTTGTVINVAYVNLVYDNIDALFTSTSGVTFNQAGGDGSILTLESSDVAHGITDFAGTQVFCMFLKSSATAGGALMRGFTETTVAVHLQAFATTNDTTKSTAAVGGFWFDGLKKSGTNIAAMDANSNIAAFASGTATKFILDADGDSHQDVGTAWTNFDDHDDVALLTALSGAVSRADDPLKASFSGWLTEHRHTLEAHRIVTINDHPGGDGSVFINWSRAQMVVIGAIRQIGERLKALEA